jgi:hypothetical protein
MIRKKPITGGRFETEFRWRRSTFFLRSSDVKVPYLASCLAGSLLWQPLRAAGRYAYGFFGPDDRVKVLMRNRYAPRARSADDLTPNTAWISPAKLTPLTRAGEGFVTQAHTTSRAEPLAIKGAIGFPASGTEIRPALARYADGNGGFRPASGPPSAGRKSVLLVGPDYRTRCRRTGKAVFGTCAAQPIWMNGRIVVRSMVLISALLVFASPAVAQNWQDYSYPDSSFRATFPADPQIEATTYGVTDDRKVEALIYFVRRDNAEFKLTVAELADSGLEPTAVVDYAIKTLSKGGEVKVNLPHHIISVFGRQLSQPRGSRPVHLPWAALSDRREISSGGERCDGRRHPIRAIAHIHRRRL